MIKSKNKETISVYFKGVSISKIYHKGILVWPTDVGELSCFNNSSSVWNDELPWDDNVNWID